MRVYYRWATYFFSLVMSVVFIGCQNNQKLKSEEPETESKPEVAPEYISTFQLSLPQEVTLLYYNKASEAHDSTAAQTTKVINDQATLSELITLTGKLKDEGDIMIKMSDVALLKVVFVYPDKKLYFDFYKDRVKTPATSFYAQSADEKALYEFLFSLLNQ